MRDTISRHRWQGLSIAALLIVAMVGSTVLTDAQSIETFETPRAEHSPTLEPSLARQNSDSGAGLDLPLTVPDAIRDTQDDSAAALPTANEADPSGNQSAGAVRILGIEGVDSDARAVMTQLPFPERDNVGQVRQPDSGYIEEPTTGHTQCKCEVCRKWVTDQKLVPTTVKRKVCIYVYEPEDVTVPYCDVKCEHGECTEIIGTKTVRKFVKRVKEVEVELLFWDVENKEPEQKCLKCGFQVTDCPKPPPPAEPELLP